MRSGPDAMFSELGKEKAKEKWLPAVSLEVYTRVHRIVVSQVSKTRRGHSF